MAVFVKLGTSTFGLTENIGSSIARCTVLYYRPCPAVHSKTEPIAPAGGDPKGKLGSSEVYSFDFDGRYHRIELDNSRAMTKL